MDSTFGQTLRDARQRKGQTLQYAASMVGIDKTYLSKMENDCTDYPPKAQVIYDLAAWLDLDPIDLCYLAGRILPEDETVIRHLAMQHGASFSAALKVLASRPELVEQIGNSQ